MSRRRPTAFQVSFPGEATSLDDESTGTSDLEYRKRTRDGIGDAESRTAKRRNLDRIPRPARKYQPRAYETQERADALIFGEEPDPPDDGKKRVRVLSHFVFFDAERDLEMVSLSMLDHHGNGSIEGAGFVAAKFEIDEDEGQEDDLEEGYEEPQYIRLPAVRRYVINYLDENCPLYVETDHALYELAIPSKKYRKEYRTFYKSHKIMQLIISSAHEDPEREFPEFLDEVTSLEILDQPLVEDDLWSNVDCLRRTLELIRYGDRVRGSSVVTHLLTRNAPNVLRIVDVAKIIRERQPTIPDIQYRGNLDLAVLRPENQVPTHVTPHISQLAIGLFKERLQVVGRRPAPQPELPNARLMERLREFLGRASSRKRIEFRTQQRLRPRSRYLKYLTIDGVDYAVGDTIVFVAGHDGRSVPPELPHPDDVSPDAILADYFWFARIMYIDGEDETVHVQWFEHSSKTSMEELGDPQELFLINRCDTVEMAMIIGIVQAHYIAPGQTLSQVTSHDFFYRYEWDDLRGSFKTANVEKMASAQAKFPPDNCHVCHLVEQFNQDLHAQKVRNGVAWHGHEYHIDDFVLIKAEEGPCHIGHILDIQVSVNEIDDDATKIFVTLLGRVDRLGCRPETTLKDNQHLFYTDDEMWFVISDLVGICYVVIAGSLPELEEWKTISPHHFYITYKFPSLNVALWSDRHRMRPDDLDVCGRCLQKNLDNFRQLKTFLGSGQKLRLLDPFAGVGALPLAMEEIGCFKLTHAIEISPSAARTLKTNASPETSVYNQCSNLVLRQAILLHGNKEPDELKSIEGGALPVPPMPGDVDCIVTGFPCQPHSSLNMFQKANDRKSDLILTILSWVDFLQPSYCIFENVRGFLQYRLRARQNGPYRIKGGIPMGGLKFLIRALTDMEYQVRMALLQAGHYGTPQSRVRFFLVAAKRGLELPDIPQPTHEFPIPDPLEIKFTNGLSIRPVRTIAGIAPHRYVSTHDAISDLPLFHWRHPRRRFTVQQMREGKLKVCDEKEPWCGFAGPNVTYEHEPQTKYQVWCRKKATRDIQHYTRTYESKKVERVVEIPLRPDADYRSLRPDLWEWQLANPVSATGRTGFRPGYYGRVANDGWFQTTVTNVDPTAKQCRVLHPYCRRIVTVRELARSQGFPDHFVFFAAGDRVVTMHRQIGNAVSWPVSMAVGREFREVLLRKWVKEREGRELDVMETG